MVHLATLLQLWRNEQHLLVHPREDTEAWLGSSLPFVPLCAPLCPSSHS